MKYNISVVVFLFCATASNAQPSCKELSLGQFFEKLKGLEPLTEELLNYKNYHGFDFATFTPVDEIRDSTVVTVGYNSKGEIQKITFKNVDNSDNNYVLLVYDFKDYRILLLKVESIPPGMAEYTPTAIFNSKKGGKNYMINVKAQFRNNYESFTLFDKFPVGKFEDISCLMSLDNDLYPHAMIKFSNLQIVLYSRFEYEFERSHNLVEEIMHFFIDAEHYYPSFKIDKNSCMNEIVSRVSSPSIESNLIVLSKPSDFDHLRAPIWIYSGAHQNDLSEK